MKLNIRPGVLGGGQLSMMLIQSAQALGILPTFLTPLKEDPACRISGLVKLGDPRKSSDLKEFCKDLDALTFESEFYDANYLKNELKTFNGTIFPSLDNLERLQDRKTQKTLFVKNKLQTSPFIHTNKPDEVRSFFKLQQQLVAKQRFNGYDGYGTFLLRTEKDVETFLAKPDLQLDQFIFEKLIRFEYEVAVQAARSRSGDVVFFPFVKTIQKDNKCFIVEGPEKSSAHLVTLQKAIQKFLNHLDYVGVIGFEFFKTKGGFILNEVAPRVHNTGHHTLDSCNLDQFTMHWLCILQDKLPKVQLKTKAFVMLNLIGESENEVQVPDRNLGALYWYGKKNRKGRKLGHVNFVGENKKALVTKALKELKTWKL